MAINQKRLEPKLDSRKQQRRAVALIGVVKDGRQNKNVFLQINKGRV